MANKTPTRPVCCSSCGSTTNLCYSPCILERVDRLLRENKTDEANVVLKGALDAGSTCEDVRGKYREVCAILDEETTQKCRESGAGSTADAHKGCNPVNDNPCGDGCAGSGIAKDCVTEEKRRRDMGEDFDCSLCYKLLYEPVTTPCGHTFCKMCLARVIDYTSACPFCRTIIHLGDPTELPQSVTLARIIQRWYPTLYEERKMEMKADPCIGEQFTLPLFVCNAVVFPGQKFPMHIFEPKYRLMLRRVMAGARKFGLINCKRDADGNLTELGIGGLLEVSKAERTPDGRSIIDTTGIGRFRVLEYQEMDGYFVGKVQRYYDTCGLDGEEVNERARKARKCIQDMLAKGGRCPTMQNALQRTGPIPCESKGPSALSLWLAGALITDLDERQRLLEMNDANERLKEVTTVLERYFRNRFCPYSAYTRSRDCTIQ